MLVQTIQDRHRHWGLGVDHSLTERFSGSDTVFLLGAFGNLSLSSFNGNADIEYRVTDSSGKIYEGVFKNGYKRLHSPSKLARKWDVIQELLDNGWPVQTNALLASLEFLYSDDYRMAVFNAATLLELAVVQFWDSPPVKCC
jgi:hypothetical protein